MKTVAIDSDPIALNILDEFCIRVGLPGLMKFSDPVEGFRYSCSNHPDIVFVDLKEDGVCGLQIAAGLPQDTSIIFTSAYPDHAAEAFNLDVVDYLHKPFSFERFKRAVIKAERRHSYNNYLKGQKSIIVKQEYNNVPVTISDILYVEAMENYSKIHTKEGKSILTHNSLKNMFSLLRDAGFIRIHKSYVVPVSEIESFNRQNLTLRGGTLLPVGRQFAPSLFRHFT